MGTGEKRRKVEIYVAPAWPAKSAEKEKHWVQFRHKIREHSKLEDTPGSNAQQTPTPTLKRKFSDGGASQPSRQGKALTTASAKPEG
jgi:hypothetical protein